MKFKEYAFLLIISVKTDEVSEMRFFMSPILR
jgi:hypothetical protein